MSLDVLSHTSWYTNPTCPRFSAPSPLKLNVITHGDPTGQCKESVSTLEGYVTQHRD